MCSADEGAVALAEVFDLGGEREIHAACPYMPRLWPPSTVMTAPVM